MWEWKFKILITKIKRKGWLSEGKSVKEQAKHVIYISQNPNSLNGRSIR